MLKFASRTLALIAFGFALFVSLFLESAFAQVYNNPVYIPAPLLAAQTLSAIGSVSYQVNSTGAVFVRFAGTNTGLIAEVDCTETRVAAPTWTAALALQPVGAGTGRIASVTANGLFWFNSSGFAQCRAKVTQLTTGSVTITFSGGPGRVIDTATIKRPTFRANFTALAPAASLTDLVTIAGSATNTIRVKRIKCSGISTANATFLFSLIKRSTLDTTGTSTTATDVPLDSSDPAGTSLVKGYTVNPGALGTAVGTIATGSLVTNTLASATVVSDGLVWQFGDDNDEEVTLRGVAENLAINGRAASMSAGAAVDCSVEWTE